MLSIRQLVQVTKSELAAEMVSVKDIKVAINRDIIEAQTDLQLKQKLWQVLEMYQSTLCLVDELFDMLNTANQMEKVKTND